MMTILKWFFGAMIGAGIVLVIGAAGSDCDGKCMENALPIYDLILYMLGGVFMIALGAFGFMKCSEYDY